MKKCLQCGNIYTDKTLNFCLSDGSGLVEQNTSEMPTAHYSDSSKFFPARNNYSVYKIILPIFIVLLLVSLITIFGILIYSSQVWKNVGSANNGQKSNIGENVNTASTKTNTKLNDTNAVDINKLKLAFSLKEHTDGVHSLAISPDGKTAASAAWDSKIILWDLENGKMIKSFKHGFHPHKVLFSQDGNFLYSSGGDGTIKRFDLKTDESKILYKADHDITQISLSKDGSTIACDCLDKGYKAISSNDGKTVFENAVNDFVWGVALSPDGKNIAKSGGKKALPVTVWNVENKSKKFEIDDGRLTDAVAFSTDGKVLAVGGSSDGTIKIYNAENGKIVKQLPSFQGQINRIIFYDNNSSLFFLSGGSAYLFDLNRDNVLRKFDNLHYDISISEDGKTILTGDQSGVVSVWRLS